MAERLDMEDLVKAREIFAGLKKFKVVNCGMVHERIKMNNGNPMIYPTENGYDCKRLSLCPKKVRDTRLGCAHASSNNRFQNYLSSLSELNTEFSSYENELRSLLLAIYKLDHQKGELEKKLAIHLSEGKKIDGIKGQIQKVITSHNELMEQLRELKKTITGLLEIII